MDQPEKPQGEKNKPEGKKRRREVTVDVGALLARRGAPDPRLAIVVDADDDKPSDLLVKKNFGRLDKQTVRQLVLSGKTSELLRQFNDEMARLRVATPALGGAHLGAEFGIGLLAFIIAYATPEAVFTLCRVEGHAKTFSLAAVCGFVDVLQGESMFQLIRQGDSGSYAGSTFSKTLNVTADKMRDRLRGIKNAQKFPVGAGGAAKAWALQWVTDGASFLLWYSISGAVLTAWKESQTYPYGPHDDPWAEFFVRNGVNTLMSGLSVMTLMAWRTAIYRNDYRPVKDKAAWRAQLEALEGMRDDINAQIKEEAEAKHDITELTKLLKNIEADIATAEVGVGGKWPIIKKKVKTMFCSRQGVSTVLGRMTSLAMSPIMRIRGENPYVIATFGMMVGFCSRTDFSALWMLVATLLAGFAGLYADHVDKAMGQQQRVADRATTTSDSPDSSDDEFGGYGSGQPSDRVDLNKGLAPKGDEAHESHSVSSDSGEGKLSDVAGAHDSDSTSSS